MAAQKCMKTGIDQLQPGHVAAGLGGANREFLSVCLGVFDDAKLSKRLEDQFRKAVSKVTEWTPIPDLALARESVARSAKNWELDERLSDNQLRVILWVRLQRALAVDPSVTRSVRGCERLVDDLVASGLRDLDRAAPEVLWVAFSNPSENEAQDCGENCLGLRKQWTRQIRSPTRLRRWLSRFFPRWFNVPSARVQAPWMKKTSNVL